MPSSVPARLVVDGVVLVADEVGVDVALGLEVPGEAVAVVVGEDRVACDRGVVPGLAGAGAGLAGRVGVAAPVGVGAVEEDVAFLVATLPAVHPRAVAAADGPLVGVLDLADVVAAIGDARGVEHRGVRPQQVAVEAVGLALDVTARRTGAGARTEARHSEGGVDRDLARAERPALPDPAAAAVGVVGQLEPRRGGRGHPSPRREVERVGELRGSRGAGGGGCDHVDLGGRVAEAHAVHAVGTADLAGRGQRRRPEETGLVGGRGRLRGTPSARPSGRGLSASTKKNRQRTRRRKPMANSPDQ